MQINTIKQTPETTNEIKGKVIRKPEIAQAILQKGWPEVSIMSLKRDRMDPEGKGSCFVFRDDEKFQEVFAEVLAERRKSREGDLDEKQKEIDDLKRQMAELRELMAASKEA